MAADLLKVAAILYLCGTVSLIASLFPARRLLGRFPLLLLAGAFAVHTLAVTLSLGSDGFAVVTQLRLALAFYSWLMVGLFLLLHMKYRLAVLGCIVAPLAFLMTAPAFAFGSITTEVPPALQSYWLPLHVTAAFAGNAVFALAFGVSLLYLLQEHRLKAKKPPKIWERFPSLESLDRLNGVLLLWGFPLMTLGILTGSLWAAAHWGEYWSWESRQISSGLTWLLYGALLHGRLTAGVSGRKAALLTILGFVILLGYFLFGDAIFPSRHRGSFD
jgi:cytochrome c-type biogenesis protein CcsB